jgi:hypothetical protein
MGTIFVNMAPKAIHIIVIKAKEIMDPIDTVMGLFVLLDTN